MRARVALVLLALLSAAPLLASQAEARCRHYSWSLGKRIDLFTSGPLPIVDSAQSLPRDGVFGLRLVRATEVIYPVQPERGSDTGYGGVVTIERIPAGRYQIALTEAGWLEALQDRQRLKLLALDLAPQCPGVRQTMEVEVASEPLTLQLGALAVKQLSIAVVRIWNFPER